MNVITDRELSAEKRTAFSAGVVIAAIASAVLHQWLYALPAVPAEAPQFVKQTQNLTVARIPTRYAGERVDCIVTIDRAKNAWSITC